jgi:DNA-directed RNA polymerase subunit alpha
MFERPRRIEWEDLSPTAGRLVAEPFEKGYALTVGNSLRRALLAALPGAALTWVRVDGAPAGTGPVAGLKEDASTLLLNLKRVVVRLTGGASATVKLSVAGPATVTAGALSGPGVEILNRDLVLGTLETRGKLSLEAGVSLGRGYVPAGRGADGGPRGSVALDAAFSPIRRVQYTVENSRLGNVIDYEKLVVEITTDGSVAPDQALLRSAKLLRDHFELFTPTGAEEEDDEPPAAGEARRA